MKINHTLINKFLDAVFPLPEQFGATTTDEGDEFVDGIFIRDAIKKVDPEAKLLWGMSKMVINSPKLDFVIKIPFNGYYSQTYYENEDNDELEWCDFYEAPTADCWDYCYAEYEKFKDLKKRNLDSFVAETLFYKEMGDFRIFLQEKIIPSYDKSIKSSIKSRQIAKKWKQKEYYAMDLDWIARCIDCYGEKKTKKFLDYCIYEDMDILSDIHRGNYGYRNNITASPALLDFSGFFG